MAWTEATPTTPTYTEAVGQTVWDDGDTTWDLTGTVVVTRWDRALSDWSAAATPATTWTDA